METFRTKDMLRIDFDSQLADSDGKPIQNRPVTQKSILYNTNVISTHEAEMLITSGMYEYDERVIAITTKQADNLAAKYPNARLSDIIRNMCDNSLSILIASMLTSPESAAKLPELVDEAVKRKNDNLTTSEKLAQDILELTGA